ncbi:hypothetical protein CDCA_CDCA01G0140 [Cyanidium caldarium]|uniref:Uncharacterized protein n=1 Tax=Cyanidium caldarium TaxID=2771 RepID=A0AAV9IPU1_CYACA|nr:hypothetical protein CDCA_CDCA01G0140 [Cyanidium caldarium]
MDAQSAPSFCNDVEGPIHPVELKQLNQPVAFVNHTVYPLQWQYYRVPGADPQAGFYRFLQIQLAPAFFLSKPGLFLRWNHTPALDNFTMASYAVAGRVSFTLYNPEYRAAPWWCVGVYGAQPPLGPLSDISQRGADSGAEHPWDPLREFILYNISFVARDAEPVLRLQWAWGMLLVLALGSAAGLVVGALTWEWRSKRANRRRI